MTIEGKKFKRTGVATAVVTALCGTASLMIAQPAFAQAQGQTLQRVEVTGSNIRRTDTETASPVQVITKDEIDRSGKATLGDYLQTLTADGQGSVPTTYGRGFAGASASGISLRGLGANATLVLVNGRRVATAVLADDAQRSFVDLNSLPLEAVERVEILKDGASSIYGSDAVAGVVNIILKKNFVGTTAKVSYGISKYSDGNEPRGSITHGFGDLEKDGFNVLLNLEMGKKDAMYLRDRTDRGPVGVAAIAQYANANRSGAGSNNIPRLGGHGVIPTNAAGVPVANSAVASIIGNVRNPDPANNTYYSRGNANGVGFARTFPGAQAFCNANANLVQDDPGGGCITDLWRQFGQVQPESQNLNFYGRFTKQINATTEGFVDVGFNRTETATSGAGTNVALLGSGGFFDRNGNVLSNAANFLLGAGHPDNPYNSAARLLYNPAFEFGVRNNHSESRTFRLSAGLKGTMGAWDYDTAVSFSDSRQTDTAEKNINWRVANALLNPTAANVAAATAFSPAYAALPAGTIWRIAENANLNSAAMYNALLEDKQREGFSRIAFIDFKASRTVGKTEGGDIGLAVGAELRREEANLPFYDGLGDYIGLSYTGYGGERNIAAVFAEVNVPVTKQLEASGALRFDRYSDAGSAVTPKLGVKWRVADPLVLRATFARAFRAPSPAENGIASVAAFGGATVNDRARTAAGVPNQDSVAPTFVQRGNPNLEPEKSQSLTFGTVWDITPKTSLTADFFQIKRKGLPVIESPQDAVDAGRVVRDPTGAVNAADPGPILTGFVQFVNSDESLTRGIDIDLKHRWDLGGGNGRMTFGFMWSHLLKQRVTSGGTTYEYAGTHGNCHVTNCIGSPKDRIQVSAAWDINSWTIGATINHRGKMTAHDPQDHPSGCAFRDVNGNPIPGDCTVKSFTTLDMSVNWKFRQNTELFGTISNVLDSKPPFDPVTYGAIGYNPLDYSGAVGRYFRIGLKHKF